MIEAYIPLTFNQLEGLFGAEHKPIDIDYIRDHLDNLCQSLISRGESKEDIRDKLDENMVVGVLGLEDTWKEKAGTLGAAAYVGLFFGGLVHVIGNGFVSEQHEVWVTLFSILTVLGVGSSAYNMEVSDLEDSMINAYRQIASKYNISLE